VRERETYTHRKRDREREREREKEREKERERERERERKRERERERDREREIEREREREKEKERDGTRKREGGGLCGPWNATAATITTTCFTVLPSEACARKREKARDTRRERERGREKERGGDLKCNGSRHDDDDSFYRVTDRLCHGRYGPEHQEGHLVVCVVKKTSDDHHLCKHRVGNSRSLS